MTDLALFKHKVFLTCILVMSLIDATLTLLWVKLSIGEEINPLLERCLEIGPGFFVASKVLLTMAGCCVLLACQKRRLARAASFLLFIFYSILMMYHSLGALVVILDN